MNHKVGAAIRWTATSRGINVDRVQIQIGTIVRGVFKVESIGLRWIETSREEVGDRDSRERVVAGVFDCSVAVVGL
jgi:hypothetical protein